MKTQPIPALSIVAVLLLAPAFAEITYLDATSGGGGNTTLADGSTFTPPLNGTTGDDDNWEERTIFGASGNIFESSGEGAGNSEDAPELRTTITGLVAGSPYSVFAYFWDPASSAEDWNIRAGANSNPGGNTLYSHPDATAELSSTASVLASSQTFAAGAAPTILAEGGRDLNAAPLGAFIADENGEIQVYVDDLGAAGTVNKRTWYDGLGYELVTTSAPIVSSSWAAGFGAPGLSGLTSTGLVWGDGTANDADDTAVHATIDGDAETFAPDPVSLADGESVRLSGKVNFQSSITDTPGTIQFRWGLFNHNGSTDASGWTGYWAGNGTNGSVGMMFRQNSTSTLYVSGNAANGTALTPGTQVPGAVNIAAGLHDFSLVLTRNGSDIEYSAIMTRSSDGALLCEMAGADSSGHTTFTRIGFLSGNALDADQLTLSQLALEYPYTPPPPPLPGDIVEVAPNGTWTWFNDERAIWHQGLLYSGYMRSDGYAGVTRYDPATHNGSHTILGTAASFQIDDHNNPSLTILPDNTLLAVYAKHLAGNQFFHRRSTTTSPGSLADWGTENVKTTPASNTYANTYRLSGTGPGENNAIYNFHRCINFNPCVTISTDDGATWGDVTQFINVGTGNTRPYPRYASDHVGRVDLIYTDGHPRNEDNSIYHMYFEDQDFRKTDGTLIKSFANLPINHGAVSDPNNGEKGSVIYQFDPAKGRGWTWDIHYGADGNPVCVYQTQRDDVTGTGWNHDRIYYYYARWTGSAWQGSFIAQGGRGIYSNEDDYGGGMALDPEDPRVVYISSNAASPFALGDLNNVPLGANERYEIYRGVTLDGGLTFTWTAVTENSTADNLRPIVPENHGLTNHLLWMKGTYTTYQNYNTKVMGVFDVPKESLADWQAANSLGGDSSLDTDHDGLSDLLEYALGGDPNDSDDRPAPTLVGDAFTFNHLPLRTDVEWVVETSSDLSEGGWTPVAVIRAGGLAHTVDPGLTLTGNPGDPASISLSPLPPDAGPRSFVRLKVRTAPLPPGQ
jgi:hypothetical protein